nr:NADH dehydrogenase subunit 6 [Pielomastax soochowensis]
MNTIWMFTISIMSSVIFMTTSHPMFMIMMIIMQTMMMGILSGMLMESFWMSYILMLIFLGGMMVLFVYITSIASNMMSSMNLNYPYLLLIMTILIISATSTDQLFMNNEILNNEVLITNNEILNKEMNNQMTNLFNLPNSILTMMIIIYLFITLTVVIKITNIKYGPVRKFLYE